MIETINIFRDLRTDKVGLAIRELRRLKVWNSEKFIKRDALFSLLKKSRYVEFSGNANRYLMKGGIGFSYLYQVPLNKRGQFAIFRGKLVRIVLTSRYKMDSYFGVHVVSNDQKAAGFHFNFLSNMEATFDGFSFNRYMNRYGEHTLPVTEAQIEFMSRNEPSFE